MNGLDFITAAPPARANPARADIACFVGFVARRPTAPLTPAEDRNGARLDAVAARLPDWLFGWLRERGWLPSADHCTREQFDRLVQLADLPVPIHTWDAFDDLFAWDTRPLDTSGRVADTLLGGAVRSFFRHGGRCCIVVRTGDPLPVFAQRDARLALQDQLLAGTASSPVDRESWSGIGHLFGLPEVSCLCVPDLPDLFAVDPPPPDAPPPPTVEERFIECAAQAAPLAIGSLRRISPPRCDETGFGAWSGFVCRVGRLLEQNAREVQLFAALPLPVDETTVAKEARRYDLPFLERRKKISDAVKAANQAQWQAAARIQTAFVQLVYPWLRTRDSATLPGDLEPPDATLAGMIANLALTRGAWRTVARESVPWLQTVEPILSREDLDRPLAPNATVSDRVTVFGPTSSGFRVLSDVTTDDDVSWRPASLDRLMNLVIRAARLAGEEFVFANNGEQLWARLRIALVRLLTALWADGALDGATPAEAFDVRCDLPATMTQADLDAGRVLVRVAFTAAAPITRLVVVLAMNESGQVSLVSAQTDGAAAGTEAP
jgi:hypothetical protein